MVKIGVLIAEGFEEIEAITIIDLLRRGQLNVVSLGIVQDRLVKGAHNMTLLVDDLLEGYPVDGLDMIVLPGGMPGTTHLIESSLVAEAILSHHGKGKPLGAICAAPSVLGKLGLLKNVEATCYPGFESQLNGALSVQSSVVLHQNILTGKGLGVAIKFSLEILKMYKNAGEVEKIQASLMLE